MHGPQGERSQCRQRYAAPVSQSFSHPRGLVIVVIIYHGGSAPSDTSDVRKHFGARCAGIINHVDGAMGWALPDDVEVVLNQHLSKNKCFLGEEFSAADIMMGGGINSMIMF